MSLKLTTMFEILGAIFLSHGIVATLRHGLPAFNEAAPYLKGKNIKLIKTTFLIQWCIFYSVLTPLVAYRLTQNRQTWVQIYASLLVKAYEQ